MGLKERIIKRLLQKRRGEPGAAGLAGVVVSVFIVIILAGAILPTAFQNIFLANTSGWTGSTVSLWTMIPMIASLAVVLLLVGLAFAAFGRRI